MNEYECAACRRPKGVLSCGICQESICKKCALFVEESTFSFLEVIPETLRHSYYCPTCHEDHVSQAFSSYNETMDRAKEVYFFFETQRKFIPIMSRSKELLKVDECVDRDEIILRLAFKAAELGYNGVIEAKVVSEKVRNESYQKSRWIASGFPAHLKIEKLIQLHERRD